MGRGFGVKHRDILTLVRLLAAIVLCIVPILSFAQSSEAPDAPDWIESIDQQPEAESDWVRPEGLEEQTPPLDPTTATVIAAYARSFEFDAKRSAIRMISERYSAGTLGAEDVRATEILSFLALERYEREIRREGRLINDFPMVRAEALQLLGAMGGTQAGVTIQRALVVERDPYVLSVAVRAAAHTTPDSAGELLGRLTVLVERMNAQSRPDNNLAQAVVQAVVEIHNRIGRIDSPELFRALISIAQGSYGYSVRQEALSVVDLLRRQDLPE